MDLGCSDYLEANELCVSKSYIYIVFKLKIDLQINVNSGFMLILFGC